MVFVASLGVMAMWGLSTPHGHAPHIPTLCCYNDEVVRFIATRVDVFMQQRTHISTTTLVMLGAAALVFAFFVINAIEVSAQASPYRGVYGWIWSGSGGGAGWIRVSACNGNDDESCPIPPAPYGLKLNPGNMRFSGHAWSNTLGWLGFNQADVAGCPGGSAASSCQAEVQGNKVVGWARWVSAKNATAAQAGGWDGWVRLDPPNYGGVSFNPNTGALSGYAYDASNAAGTLVGSGWLEFNGANHDVVVDVVATILSFIASPQTIQEGQSTRLTWNSNANTCTGTNFNTGGAPSNAGGVNVSPTGDTTYLLSCTYNGFPVTTDQSVAVNVLSPGVTISVDQQVVRPGSIVTVSWNATNVRSCTVAVSDGSTLTPTPQTCGGSGVCSLSDSETYTMGSASVTFTANCTNQHGVSAEATTQTKLVPSFREL